MQLFNLIISKGLLYYLEVVFNRKVGTGGSLELCGGGMNFANDI